MITARSILIGLILLFFLNKGISQEVTFKKIIGPAIDYTSACYSFNDSKTFMWIGDYYGLLSILELDSIGNVSKSKRYSFVGSAGLGEKCRVVFINDTIFLLMTSYGGLFLKLDTSLNILTTLRFNNLNIGTLFYLNFDKGYFFSGNSLTNHHPVFLRTDSLCTVIWAHQFNDIYGGIQQIVQSPDSGYVLAMNIDSAGACLVKTDSVGNILWAKSYFRPKGYVHSMFQNNDGSIIITGNLDSISNYNMDLHLSPLFMSKIDPSGNVIWSKLFGDLFTSFHLFPSFINSTIDGGYIISATVAKSQNDYDVLLIKTDANGDTLWTRVHGTPSTMEVASTIEQLPDKGYIISNFTNGYQGNNSAYIIRTDSLGHTDSMCQENNISLPVNIIFPTDSNIILTTVPITISVSTPTITTDIFPGGIYDGCDLTVNVKPFEIKKYSFSTYPNPTSGVVNIKTTILPNYTKKNYITVYDSMGTIIIQKPFTNQQEQQVDLSKYAKGIYLIKINEGEKVSTKKVVVE